MSSGEWVVSVYVFTASPEAVAKAAEVLGRAVAGLALEGVDATLRVGTSEDDDEPSA